MPFSKGELGMIFGDVPPVGKIICTDAKMGITYDDERRFGVEYEIPIFFNDNDRLVPISSYLGSEKEKAIDSSLQTLKHKLALERLGSEKYRIWKKVDEALSKNEDTTFEEKERILIGLGNCPPDVANFIVSFQEGSCRKPHIELRTPPNNNLRESYEYLLTLSKELEEMNTEFLFAPIATYNVGNIVEGAGLHVHLSPSNEKLVLSILKQYIPLLLGLSCASLDMNYPQRYHSFRNVLRASYYTIDGRYTLSLARRIKRLEKKYKKLSSSNNPSPKLEEMSKKVEEIIPTIKPEIMIHPGRGTIEVTIADTQASLKDSITFVSFLYALVETIESRPETATDLGRNIGEGYIMNAILEREREDIACEGPNNLYRLTDDFKKIRELLPPSLIRNLYRKRILFDWLKEAGFIEEIPYSEQFDMVYKTIYSKLKEHEAPSFVFHILDDFKMRLHCEADSQQQIIKGKDQDHLIREVSEIFKRDQSLIKEV